MAIIVIRVFAVLIRLQKCSLRVVRGDDLLRLHVILQQLHVISSEFFTILGYVHVELLNFAEDVVYAGCFPIYQFAKHRHGPVGPRGKDICGLGFFFQFFLFAEILLLQLLDLVAQRGMAHHLLLSTCTRIVNINVEFFEFLEQPYLIHFHNVAFNGRVPKIRCQVRLKITEFFEKARDLYDDAKDIFFGGVVVHRKTFNSFVVLDHWIKAFLL